MKVVAIRQEKISLWRRFVNYLNSVDKIIAQDPQIKKQYIIISAKSFIN